MSTLNNNSFFDDQLLSGPRPLDNMSPAERIEYQRQAALNPKGDPEIEALSESFGPFMTGLYSSGVGKASVRSALAVKGLFSDDESYMTPLNFETKSYRETENLYGTGADSLDQFDQMNKPYLTTAKNNIEGITEELLSVDPTAHSWILSSSSYGEFLDRIELTRVASPEFAAKSSGLGVATGFTLDAAAIVGMSLAMEPLAFVGYGQRFIQSGQQIARLRATERFGAMYRISEQAAEASQMVGRLSGMARYAALGLAEEAALKVVRNNIDPLYDPDAASIVFDSTIAMALGGAIGGFAARSYAANRIERYAEDYYHQTRLGGGMVINHHTPFAFVGNSAADRTLLGRTTLPVGETVDGLADEAWEAYSRTGREFVPGSESMALPVMQGEGAINRAEDVGAAMLAGQTRPAAFGPSMYTPGNQNFLSALLNEGRSTGWRGRRAAETGMPPARGAFARTVRRIVGLPERPRPSGVVFTNRRGARQLAGDIGEDVGIERNLYEGGTGQGTGIEIELDSATLRGDFIESNRVFAAAQEGDVAFRYAGNWRNLNRSIRSVTISPVADPAEASRVSAMFAARRWNRRQLQDGTVVFTPPNRPRFAATNEQWRGAVTGIQSTVLNIVAEIQRRGGTVNQDLARTVARTLFAVHAEGGRLGQSLSGAAFESRVWATLNRFVDPRVMERIQEARRLGNVTPISTLDSAFDDLVQRRETMDGLWDHFENMVTSAPIGVPQGASLILQVANEVRRRGGEVSREVFEEIIEDLRSVMQNPPMRENARGVMMLDSRARLSQIAEIINRRVPQNAERVVIPRALENSVRTFGTRLDQTRQAVRAREQARIASGAPPVPGAPGAAGAAPPPSAAAAGAPGAPAVPGAPATPGAPAVPGGAGGGGNAPNATNSLDGALRMQEEIAQLDRFDTLGPIARFFNQAAVVMRFDNPAGRMAVSLAFNARRALQTRGGTRVAQGQTVFERGTYEMTGYLAQGLTAYRNGYTRFALGRGAGDRISMMDGLRAGFGRGARQRIDEFNRAVMEQARTGAYNHANDGVNETARQFREILNNMHTAANQAGVRGFQTSAVQNYMPRLWRWDRIARLGTTVEGREALRNLMEAALGRGTGARQLVLEDGTVQTLADVPAAARVLADRLISLANNSDLAPVLDTEMDLARAIDDLLGPLSGPGTSRTPFGRTRIILDETADHVTAQDLLNSGRSGISIADLTVDDVPTLLKKYTVSVFGAINERRFIDQFNEQLAHFAILRSDGNPVQAETVEEVYSIINQIGNLSPALGGSLGSTEIDALREIVAALRYEPLHRSNRDLGSLGRVGDSLTGILLPLGYLSTGGAFGLVAAAETSRIIGTLGLRTTLKQVPLISEMVSNWRNMDEGPRNFASLLDQAFHPSTDRIRRTLMMQVQNQYGTGANVVERGLASAANFFSDATLLSPVTSFTQNLMAASTIQHFYDVAQGAVRRMDDATIRTLGLEPNQYDELVDYVGTNAITANRAGSTRVVDLNNINDIRVDNLRNFLDRAVRTRIQDMPTRGDFHRIGFSFFGRLFTQFRGFNLKGVDNFALQNLSRIRRGDTNTSLRVGQEIAFTMVFAALVQYSRHYIDAQSYRQSGNDEKADEIEKNLLGVEGFVRGAAAGPSEFFLPIFAIDAGWSTFISDDPLFSPYRYSGLQWYGFPAASFLGKSWDISKDVLGATYAKALGIEDKEREITERTIHKARLITPFQNFLPVKHLFNIAEEEISREFQLLERQPRKNRKVEG